MCCLSAFQLDDKVAVEHWWLITIIKYQNNQKIQLYKKCETYAQKWILIKNGEGYKIASACNPNFMIDLSGGELKADGYGYLNLWYDNGTYAQRWNFKKVQ